MDAARYVQHLRTDGDAFARAAEGNLTAPVPPCPEWTVADLVDHLAGVHSFWGQIVSRSLQSPADVEQRQRQPDDRLLDDYVQGLHQLAAVLTEAVSATGVWTWSRQNDVAWVQRRMAQETAVHRWDAQSATRPPDPIDPELAVDGVEEFLDFFLGHPEMAKRFDGEPASLHLHSTDAAGEWLIETGGGTVTVHREHGKGDAAVRAPASDLLLLLWRRRSPGDLEVLGDMGSVLRFLANTKVE